MKGNEQARCPRCGEGASGFAAVAKREIHAKEGGVALCAYCGGANIYRADLTLRMPTALELDEVAAVIQEALGARVHIVRSP